MDCTAFGHDSNFLATRSGPVDINYGGGGHTGEAGDKSDVTEEGGVGWVRGRRGGASRRGSGRRVDGFKEVPDGGDVAVRGDEEEVKAIGGEGEEGDAVGRAKRRQRRMCSSIYRRSRGVSLQIHQRHQTVHTLLRRESTRRVRVKTTHTPIRMLIGIPVRRHRRILPRSTVEIALNKLVSIVGDALRHAQTSLNNTPLDTIHQRLIVAFRGRCNCRLIRRTLGVYGVRYNWHSDLTARRKSSRWRGTIC